MMKSLIQTILAVILVVIIGSCLVLILSKPLRAKRIADLTEENIYTLSKGTQNTLKKLNQTITLKLFYTKAAARKGPEQIKFWSNYARYVTDLLREYERLSGNKIKLQIIDPRPFSEAEAEAIKYGLKRFQLSDTEAFIFGMVATSEFGKSKVIEFFQPERQQLVEYDVTKLITELMEREKRKIGVISSLPVMGSDM
ncbi:MAG: gliding motility protein GldG, partial [Lentisphaerae bacterium]